MKNCALLKPLESTLQPYGIPDLSSAQARQTGVRAASALRQGWAAGLNRVGWPLDSGDAICVSRFQIYNKNVIFWNMNSKQMKKWLEQQGATFLPGKGSHLKVFLKGHHSALPMHGTAELGKGP